MAFGGRVFQVLPANMVPVFTQLVYVAWLLVVLFPVKGFGLRDFWEAAWWRCTPSNSRITLRAWHRALGLAWHDPPFPHPMPPPIAVVFVLFYKLERSAWHVVDLALVVARFLLTRKWPHGWSTYDPDVVMKATMCTGMGDLIYIGILRCERARHLGVRTVWADWSHSSYLTDPGANLFAELFDVVRNPEARADDPLITSELPPGAGRIVSIPEVYADFGVWHGWRFTLAPRIYFEGTPARWRAAGEEEWADDPLDASPRPFHSTLCMPVNRGVMRRLIRDGTHFTNSIRLKPRFLRQFEAFKASALDGKKTVGVHVRAGNGEKGHFLIHGRGRTPISSARAAMQFWLAPARPRPIGRRSMSGPMV